MLRQDSLMNVDGSTKRENSLLAWLQATVPGLRRGPKQQRVAYSQYQSHTKDMAGCVCFCSAPESIREHVQILAWCANLLLPLKPCCKILNPGWLQSAGGGGTGFGAMAVQEMECNCCLLRRQGIQGSRTHWHKIRGVAS